MFFTSCDRILKAKIGRWWMTILIFLMDVFNFLVLNSNALGEFHNCCNQHILENILCCGFLGAWDSTSPHLKAKKLACCCFIDVRRHETPESETKDHTIHSPGSSMSIRIFTLVPLAPKFKAGDTKSPGNICKCSELCYRREPLSSRTSLFFK